MTRTNNRSRSKSQSRIKKNKIPSIPFTLEEVYALSQYQATKDLVNRLRVWKAGKDYQFIKSLDELIIRSPAGKSTKQEKELERAYVNWLVSLESDQFKALDKVRIDDSRLHLDREQQEEEEYKDMLTHSGIL